MPDHKMADDGYWWCLRCDSTCRSDNPCDHCDDDNRAVDDEAEARAADDAQDQS